MGCCLWSTPALGSDTGERSRCRLATTSLPPCSLAGATAQARPARPPGSEAVRPPCGGLFQSGAAAGANPRARAKGCSRKRQP